VTPPDQAIFDAHSDLPFHVVREREAGRSAVVESDFVPGMRAGGITTRITAVYVDETYLPEKALSRALVILSELQDDLSESDGAELVTSAQGVAEADESEDISLLIGMEGSEPLMGDPRLLDAFYRSGLRLLTLTHSRRNAVGDGVPLSSTQRGTPGGLTATGIDVINCAEALGVVVDISHLNAPGVSDALSVAEQPVVASHSNCRALCDHSRNLTDDQLRAVADNGGVVCLTAVGDYVAATSPDLVDFCDHVEHAVDVAGVEHVGLGFDFFKYLSGHLSNRERERLADIGTVDGLESDQAVAAVPAALRERGFSEDELSTICRRNLRRVFGEVLG